MASEPVIVCSSRAVQALNIDKDSEQSAQSKAKSADKKPNTNQRSRFLVKTFSIISSTTYIAMKISTLRILVKSTFTKSSTEKG